MKYGPNSTIFIYQVIDQTNSVNSAQIYAKYHVLLSATKEQLKLVSCRNR